MRRKKDPEALKDMERVEGQGQRCNRALTIGQVI